MDEIKAPKPFDRQQAMAIEIERKFLVTGPFKHLAKANFEIKQGYLTTDPERTVRIRLTNQKGFITIKGASDKSGMSRLEWENEIAFADANALLNLCHKPIIEKRRFVVNWGNKKIEVDEFGGENLGLIMAEIELTDATESFELPDWFGLELTNDRRYYNSYLSKHPYTKWSD